MDVRIGQEEARRYS